MGALGPSGWDFFKQTQPRGGVEESGVSGGLGGQSLARGLCLRVHSLPGCWCHWLVDLCAMLEKIRLGLQEVVEHTVTPLVVTRLCKMMGVAQEMAVKEWPEQVPKPRADAPHPEQGGREAQATLG